MGKASKQSIETKCKTLFILDKETIFLTKKIDEEKNKTISSFSEFNKFLKNKFQVENVVALVELDWNMPIAKFYGYEVARELMNSPNRLSKFNLLFITTFTRTLLYDINNNSNRVFTKCFQHKPIDDLFEIEKLQVATISERKFDYLRRYCLTETGILEKLEHDLRPGKNLSSPQIEDLIRQMKANGDLLGVRVMNLLIETNAENFQNKRFLIYENLVFRIKEVLKSNHVVLNDNSKDIWKPFMLIIEDDIDQQIQIGKSFSSYFRIEPFNNGFAALDRLHKASDQVSVVICDMELLDEYLLDNDIQGIDVIEHIKELHPHIVLKVVSHLPRRGLNMMLGDILKASDLLYKSMLIDGNADYIADLAREIQGEIDLRRTFQRLRGPESALWSNITKQGNEGGRLKQFYYEYRNSEPDEFKEMWDEIDEEVRYVLSKKSKISTRFGSTDDRKVEKLSRNKVHNFLKELLINRLFWIKRLYTGQKGENVNFDDYKEYFIKDFLLFKKDSKRFSNYATVTGFNFKQKPDGSYKFIFNEFLEEELDRKPSSNSSSTKDLDIENTPLFDEIFKIIEIIERAGGQAMFTKNKYPTCKAFNDEKSRLPLAIKILSQLCSEKPSDDLKSLPPSREKISALLEGLKANQDYNVYTLEIKNLIKKSITNMSRS